MVKSGIQIFLFLTTATTTTTYKGHKLGNKNCLWKIWTSGTYVVLGPDTEGPIAGGMCIPLAKSVENVL